MNLIFTLLVLIAGLPMGLINTIGGLKLLKNMDSKIFQKICREEHLVKTL